jgi:L-lactate dehydrogenase complex protein LldF
MHQIASTFLEESEKKASDLGHRQTINFNIGKYNTAVKAGKQQFSDLPGARERAKNIKWRAIEHLDNHLEEFEQNFTRRGGKVIWAEQPNRCSRKSSLSAKPNNARAL